MPILKNAKKALRQTKTKTSANKTKKEALRKKLTVFKKEKSPKLLGELFALIDKSAKTGVIHKNKAAHLKSRLSKLVKSPSAKSKTPSKTS